MFKVLGINYHIINNTPDGININANCGSTHLEGLKKFVLENLPYLLFFYIGNIFASHVNSYVGGDIIDRILVAFSQIDTLKYIPSLKIKNLIPSLILSVVIKLILIQKKNLFIPNGWSL